MSLFFVLLSIALSYFSPPEIDPAWAKYHLQQFILFPAFLGTVILASHQLRFQWPQHFLILGFWFALVMSRLTGRWFGGALNAFLVFGVVVAVYFLVSLNTFTPARIRVVCGTFALCAVVMAIQATLAYHTGYQQEKLVRAGRIAGWGIVGDSNDFAQFLLVALAFLGAFWKKGSVIRNALLFPPACLLIYDIYLTLSRGAMLGLLTVILIAVSSKIPKVVSAGVAIMATLIFVALGFGGGREFSLNEGSAAGRVMAWGSGIADLKAHPIFGVGYALFTDFNELTAHNSFVLCFAELGLFGYFFWLGLVVTIIIGLERVNRIPPASFPDQSIPGLLRALRAGFYTFLVTSWFLSRTYNETLFILFALCGSLIHLPQVAALVPATPRKPVPWLRLTLACEFMSLIIVYVTVRLRSF